MQDNYNGVFIPTSPQNDTNSNKTSCPYATEISHIIAKCKDLSVRYRNALVTEQAKQLGCKVELTLETSIHMCKGSFNAILDVYEQMQKYCKNEHKKAHIGQVILAIDGLVKTRPEDIETQTRKLDDLTARTYALTPAYCSKNTTH